MFLFDYLTFIFYKFYIFIDRKNTNEIRTNAESLASLATELNEVASTFKI